MSKRAALYLRQSKADDQGIERQAELTRKLAESREWTVVETYLDDGVSASKTRGSGTAWSRLLSDATSGLVDVVVAVDLDRLLRSTRDLNVLIDHGLAVITVNGEIDLTTADGELRASMLASIARFEVRRKGERQTRANAQRATNGGVPKGARLTGYATNGELVPEEAERVRGLFEGFASGESLHGLSRASGLTPSTVRTILTNPRYAGRRVYKGQVVAGPAGVSWEPIVPEALFDLVSRRLADPARVTNRTGSTARKHLGVSLYQCGECEDAPTLSTAGSGGRYWCKACGMVRRMDHVDDFVKRVLLARLSRQDAREALAPDVDSYPLRTELSALRARKVTLAELLADGTLSAEDVRDAAAKLDARIEAVRIELDYLEAPGAMAVTPEEIASGLEAMTTDRLRAVIGLLMTVKLRRGVRGRRTFDPATVLIEWRR